MSGTPTNFWQIVLGFFYRFHGEVWYHVIHDLCKHHMSRSPLKIPHGKLTRSKTWFSSDESWHNNPVRVNVHRSIVVKMWMLIPEKRDFFMKCLVTIKSVKAANIAKLLNHSWGSTDSILAFNIKPSWHHLLIGAFVQGSSGDAVMGTSYLKSSPES